jgi:transcriptional regulator with XRE-family HTH domain
MSRGSADTGRVHELEQLDISHLGAMLRERRGNLSLRQAAQEAGVSFSTFSRVEAGSHPDLTSFMLLCGWLGVAPSQFFKQSLPREIEPIEEAIAHLSSDPRLEPEAAQRIADVLRGMYSALARDRETTPVLACHLRAASAMRPGVPERLNSLLAQMHSNLERKVAAREL